MFLFQGKEALEELINDKLSGDEVSEKDKEELLKLLTDHFQNPPDLKKNNSRFSRKSSLKSNVVTINESKPPELENKEIPVVDTELSLTNDIIKPIQNNTNVVKVN